MSKLELKIPPFAVFLLFAAGQQVVGQPAILENVKLEHFGAVGDCCDLFDRCRTEGLRKNPWTNLRRRAAGIAAQAKPVQLGDR